MGLQKDYFTNECKKMLNTVQTVKVITQKKLLIHTLKWYWLITVSEEIYLIFLPIKNAKNLR